MADERDDIRARIDIVELVGREIQLKRTGKTWKGLCPFHPDKNPSFTVSPETGRYKCWSCGEAGDIFTWEMKRRNVDFVEALQTLADQAGVTLEKRSGMAPSVRHQHEAAMLEAQNFFLEQLQKNASAREYCDGRGLDESLLKKWGIGYAPMVEHALATQLQKKGFALAECKSLFLVEADNRGGFFDKFRGRLMFPIYDEKGTLVAFGGRVLGDGTPKYINSSDTPLYKKSRVLYGMSVARDDISRLRQAVLTEGYLDVIACHRAGVTNAIASLGTSLSEDHAKLLSRWCEEVVILYDGDSAGLKAADRAVGILRNEKLNVRIASVPAGDDPDTLLKRDGPAAVKAAVTDALEPIEYFLRILATKHQPSEEVFWSEAIEILAQSRSMVEADRHIVSIAHLYPWERNEGKARAQLKASVVAARKRSKVVVEHDRPAVAVEHRALKGSLTPAEIVLFRCALSEELRAPAWNELAKGSDLFESSTATEIAKALTEAFGSTPPTGRSSDWLHSVKPESLLQLLSDLMHDFRSENLSEDRLTDSIKVLQEAKAKRDLEDLRRSGMDANERLQRLKNLKPDYKKVQKQNDGLF